MRIPAVLTCVAVLIVALPAYAQAPDTGPLVLRIPATPRTAALGDAWVAGRDQDVLFYNPAQLIGARTGLDVSIAQPGPSGTMATLGSVYAAGRWSLTLGWGVQAIRFDADTAAPYPYSPDVLLSEGSTDAFSALFAVGGAFVHKNVRVGVAGKYVLESSPPGTAIPGRPWQHRGAFVFDVGVARNLWGGVIAGSIQNLGSESDNADDGDDDEEGDEDLAVPSRLLVGWSTTRQAGPLDLGIFTQIGRRDGWTSAGAGLEVGYSWIQGYNVALRVGARRPETKAEHPVAFGLVFTADRLTIEYAVRFFEGGRTANGVTIRWR